MRYTFFATLKSVFQLDDPTFALLEYSMRHHYSDDVRSTTKHGGFMYGLRGRRDFHKDTPDNEYRNTLELSSRDLQLCMKALEMRHYQAAELQDRLDQLDVQLHKIWHALVEASEKVNEELQEAGGEV